MESVCRLECYAVSSDLRKKYRVPCELWLVGLYSCWLEDYYYFYMLFPASEHDIFVAILLRSLVVLLFRPWFTLDCETLNVAIVSYTIA